MDVLPKLQYNGTWLEPETDGAELGAPDGVPRSSEGQGIMFTVAPRFKNQPFTFSFTLMFESQADIQWWHYWYRRQCKSGARVFVARLPLLSGWRYCVCRFTGAPSASVYYGYYAAYSMTVQVVANFATEAEIYG